MNLSVFQPNGLAAVNRALADVSKTCLKQCGGVTNVKCNVNCSTALQTSLYNAQTCYSHCTGKNDTATCYNKCYSVISSL